MIEAEVRTKMLALLTAYTDQIFYNMVEEDTPDTFVYFVRSDTDIEQDSLLNGTPTFKRISFDVECVSPDLPTAMAMASALQAFQTFTGVLTSTFVCGCNFSEQSDEYEYHHDYSANGLAVSPCKLEFVV